MRGVCGSLNRIQRLRPVELSPYVCRDPNRRKTRAGGRGPAAPSRVAWRRPRVRGGIHAGAGRGWWHRAGHAGRPGQRFGDRPGGRGRARAENPGVHLQEQVEPTHPLGPSSALLDDRDHRYYGSGLGRSPTSTQPHQYRAPPVRSPTSTQPHQYRAEQEGVFGMSKTKGGGSTRNGRDSNAQRLGVKTFGGTAVQAGSIILRHRGTSFHPALNVGGGGDDPLFPLSDGPVQSPSRKGRKLVDVVTDA